MRATRLLAAGAALILTAGLAGSAAAAPATVTFHGVFTEGTAYWSTGPADPQFTLPVAGTWNLNVNLNLTPAGRAKVSNIVLMPGGGIAARWMENELDLAPLTRESSVAQVVPDLVGVVNDPDRGIYAYETHVAFEDRTFVVVYDANGVFYDENDNERRGLYLYATVPGPDFACPAPSVDVPKCYDTVLIQGTRR
jgi:hypothetical protein